MKARTDGSDLASGKAERGRKTPEGFVPNRLGVLDGNSVQLLVCALLLVLFMVMGRLSAGTFTDDDLGRFLSAQVVFEFPEKLVGLWTRPAFMVLYALPARLGYGAVEVTTAIVAAATCWLGVRAAQRLGESQPVWAAMFTAFQPLFLLLSFSALAEPLAALLLIAAVERLLSERPMQSAVAASLIPLARLELALVLPIFALFYLLRRPWKAIVLLPLGLLAWNVAGWAISRDPLFLVHQVFIERERTQAALGAGHYASGIIHAVGPVVFFFAILGLADSLKRRFGRDPKFDGHALIVSCAVVMFAYYTLSASRSGSLQSAGYLRHLVSISPLVALLAVRGWNRWLFEPPRLGMTLLALALPVLGWFYLSYELLNRYVVGETREHLSFGILLLLAMAGLLRWFAGPLLARALVQVALLVVIAGAAAGSFFAKHGPLPWTREQQVMRDTAGWCSREGLLDRMILCNHPAFHFFAGTNPNHDDRYPRLTREALEVAPVSSIAIWEGHYGHGLAGGVDLGFIETNRGLRALRRFLGPERLYFSVVLEKVGTAEDEPVELRQDLYRHRGFSVVWDLPSASGWRLEREQEGTVLLRGVLDRDQEGSVLSGGVPDRDWEGALLPRNALDGKRSQDPRTNPEIAPIASLRMSLELSVDRFYNEWHNTLSYGERLRKLLADTPGLRIVDVAYIELGDWMWIACSNTDGDLLVGTTVSQEQHSALKLIGVGPSGSLAELRSELPRLAQGLRFDSPLALEPALEAP